MMKFIQYVHHGNTVWVREDMQGLHKDICLCYDCARFYPHSDRNCPIAQEIYELNVRHKLVTPVLECPVFEEDHD